MVDDMAGEHDMLLHLVELLRIDRRQGVFLRLDSPVLQCEIDLGKGDRRGIGTAGAWHGEIGRHVRDAHLQTLHVAAFADRPVRCRLARAVIGDGGYVIARSVLISLGQALEYIALGVGDEMRGIAERIGDNR